MVVEEDPKTPTTERATDTGEGVQRVPTIVIQGRGKDETDNV